MEFSTLNGYKVKDKKAIRYYDTIADMKSDTTLKSGMYVKTKGYYSSNDGGQGEYIIINDNTLIDDGGSIHTLSNGLKAKILIDRTITTKQFGAVGNGITDDLQQIQSLFNFVSQNLTDGCEIIVNGEHYIDGSLQLNGTENNKLKNISIHGLKGTRSYWNQKSLKYGFIFKAKYSTTDFSNNFGIRINQSIGCTIKYLYFTTDEIVAENGVPLNNNTLLRTMNSSCINIEKCNFTKGYIGYFSYYNGLAHISCNNFAQCNIGLRMAENGDSQIVDNYINTNGANVYNLDGSLKEEYQDLYSLGQLFGIGIYIGGSGNHTIKGGKIEWNLIGVWQDYTTNVIYNGIQFDRCSLVGIAITGHNSMINRTLISDCNFSGCGGINPTSSYIDRHIGGMVNASITADSSFGLTITNNKFIGDNGTLRNSFITSDVYYAPRKAIYFNNVYESIFTNNIIQIDTTYLGEILNSEILFDNNITNKDIYINNATLLYKMEGLKKKVFNTTNELTNGNFNQGDEIINWSTLISGWRCTSGGTFKTISTPVTVVTTATDYYPGDNTVIDCGTSYVSGIRTGAYVSIAGVTGTKKITGVIKINDHYYAKLNSACDVAVSNATMTNVTPTFAEL